MDDGQYVELLCAIREHSGLELSDIRQAGNHGADAGWAGFTYTADCVEFYDANETTIYTLLNEAADDFGYENVDALVASFNRSDMLDTPDGRKNLLAWYALEEVGRHAEMRRENR